MSTTVSAMAAISPLLPTGLFTGVAVVSGLMSLVISHLFSHYQHCHCHKIITCHCHWHWQVLPETHGASLPDTAEQSEEVELVSGAELCSCTMGPDRGRRQQQE